MNLEKLSNNELVKLCANNPSIDAYWRVFYDRFNDFIWVVICRECKNRSITRKNPHYKVLINDFVQNIYMKLLENNCKALKKFKGKHNNSFYKYLGIIVRNEIKNYQRGMGMKKRSLPEVSIDSKSKIPKGQDNLFIRDHLKATYGDIEESLALIRLKEDIDMMLDNILEGETKIRDKLIVNLHIYEEFTAREIATLWNFDLSIKRIANILSESKQKLRDMMNDKKNFKF